MTVGTLFGIGVGPGDPELITVKGAGLIARSRHVFAPKAEPGSDSLALAIARRYLGPRANVYELVFPMVTEQATLAKRWDDSAMRVASVLSAGEDACFLTLGDPLLYSTYIYLLRALRRRMPEVRTVTVPGVPAFCAAAALVNIPVGEGKDLVRIVPTSDNLNDLRQALAGRGTVILMKLGKRLPEVLDVLGEHGALSRAVLVSRVGLPGERVEADLIRLQSAPGDSGYLSIVIVPPADAGVP